MSFDVVPYIMGKQAGGSVVIEGGIVCTDDGEGNVEVEEVTNDGE